MGNLRSAIERLADDLVAQLLAAVRRAPLGDLAAGSATDGRETSTRTEGRSPSSSAAQRPSTRRTATGLGRLPRRSAQELRVGVERVATFVGTTSNGASFSEIRKATAMRGRELPKLIELALEDGVIRKRGKTRGVRYFPPETPPRKRRRPKGGDADQNVSAADVVGTTLTDGEGLATDRPEEHEELAP